MSKIRVLVCVYRGALRSTRQKALGKLSCDYRYDVVASPYSKIPEILWSLLPIKEGWRGVGYIEICRNMEKGTGVRIIEGTAGF